MAGFRYAPALLLREDMSLPNWWSFFPKPLIEVKKFTGADYSLIIFQPNFSANSNNVMELIPRTSHHPPANLTHPYGHSAS